MIEKRRNKSPLRLQRTKKLPTFFIVFKQNVMFVRSDGAWNPLDPKNNHRTEILQRILTNTVEQLLLTVGSTIILSTYLKPSQMIIIPIFVILWCLGRIVFELR